MLLNYINNYFGCIKLRTGAITIGIVYISCSIMLNILVTMDLNRIYFSEYEDVSIIEERTIYPLWYSFVATIIILIVDTMMLGGIEKENEKLLIPWLVFHLIYPIISVIIFIVAEIIWISYYTWYIILFGVFVVFSMYNWLIIARMYQLMKNKKLPTDGGVNMAI